MFLAGSRVPATTMAIKTNTSDCFSISGKSDCPHGPPMSARMLAEDGHKLLWRGFTQRLVFIQAILRQLGRIKVVERGRKRHQQLGSLDCRGRAAEFGFEGLHVAAEGNEVSRWLLRLLSKRGKFRFGCLNSLYFRFAG